MNFICWCKRLSFHQLVHYIPNSSPSYYGEGDLWYHLVRVETEYCSSLPIFTKYALVIITGWKYIKNCKSNEKAFVTYIFQNYDLIKSLFDFLLSRKTCVIIIIIIIFIIAIINIMLLLMFIFIILIFILLIIILILLLLIIIILFSLLLLLLLLLLLISVLYWY